MPKSPAVSGRRSATFIKWMSRINTWMYRHQHDGEDTGGTFRKIPVAAADHHRPGAGSRGSTRSPLLRSAGGSFAASKTAEA